MVLPVLEVPDDVLPDNDRVVDQEADREGQRHQRHHVERHPMKFITMKEEMTEIGRVSPVITVERHELRKQKTMKMVRIPPRTRVVWTS